MNFEINYKVETLEDMYKEVRKHLLQLEIKAEDIHVVKKFSEKDGSSWSITIDMDARSIYCFGDTAVICIADMILNCLKFKSNPMQFPTEENLVP